jgi:hypothetical protein
MPGFDRSGPMGAGPMTGGRRGLCNPANTGYGGRNAGTFGFGGGMGFGRGFRGGFGPGGGRFYGSRGWNQQVFYPANLQDPEEELRIMKAQANSLQDGLDMINRRISKLEKSSE